MNTNLPLACKLLVAIATPLVTWMENHKLATLELISIAATIAFFLDLVA